MKVFKYEIEDGIGEQVAKANKLIASLSIVEKDLPPNPDLLLKTVARANPNQIDLFYYESILVSSGWNSNDDVFDVEELAKAYMTPVDKPVNFMHNEKDIIGHMTSSMLLSEGKVLTDTTNLPSKLDVAVGSVIYKFWENAEQKERIDKLIAEIKQGLWCVSMECIFPHFDYAVITPEGNQKVIARNDETSILTKYLKMFGGNGEYKGYRIGRLLRNYSFSGKGVVDNPANPRSDITSFSDKNEISAFEGSLASIQIFNETKEINNMPVEITKEQYDSVVAELNALKAKASESTQNEIKSLNDTIAAKASEIEVQKEIVEQKDAAIAKLQEQLDATKAELAKSLAEIEKTKLATIKAERFAKLIEKGVAEDKAREKAEKFAAVSEELFNDILDANPVAQSKKEEDMKKEECAKKEEKAKCEEKTEALKKAESKEPPLATSSSQADADLIISKASAWFSESSVASAVKSKKDNK